MQAVFDDLAIAGPEPDLGRQARLMPARPVGVAGRLAGSTSPSSRAWAARRRAGSFASVVEAVEAHVDALLLDALLDLR